MLLLKAAASTAASRRTPNRESAEILHRLLTGRNAVPGSSFGSSAEKRKREPTNGKIPKNGISPESDERAVPRRVGPTSVATRGPLAKAWQFVLGTVHPKAIWRRWFGRDHTTPHALSVNPVTASVTDPPAGRLVLKARIEQSSPTSAESEKAPPGGSRAGRSARRARLVLRRTAKGSPGQHRLATLHTAGPESPGHTFRLQPHPKELGRWQIHGDDRARIKRAMKSGSRV